jgi:hypothetical protein
MFYRQIDGYALIVEMHPHPCLWWIRGVKGVKTSTGTRMPDPDGRSVLDTQPSSCCMECVILVKG